MFDWNSYLSLAEELIDLNIVSEEASRASISRAYYSAFNLCKQKYLSLIEEELPKQDSHKYIIDKFKNSKKVGRTIGYKLDTLKLSRVSSDYDPKKRMTKQNANDAVKTAKSIIESLTIVDASIFE